MDTVKENKTERMTIEDIREHDPCYDPIQFLPENWTGTALDILQIDDCPAEDRLWVVTHPGWIDDIVLRQWIRWCALQVIDLWDAQDVVREYLETGNEELQNVAWVAAWAAAGTAAGGDAASAAARDAASTVTSAATWSVASAAARDAVKVAARVGAGDEWGVAGTTAWDAACDAQVEKLIELTEKLQS